MWLPKTYIVTSYAHLFLICESVYPMFVRQPERTSVTLPGIGGRRWPAHEHFAPGKLKQFVSLHLCLIFRKSQSARCDVIYLTPNVIYRRSARRRQFQPLPRPSEIRQELGCKTVPNRTSPIDKAINRIH